MVFELNQAPTLWALADCNNFYVSCERLFRPDLHGRPAVVLSNNDGCIVSRSNEAKDLGIKMGVPAFKIRNLLQRQKVAVFSSNYALYGDLSSRVIQTMETMVPEIEQYSIDEAFIPLRQKALSANADEICAAIRARVLRWTGIPTTFGVAETKTLAKLAASQGKRIQREKKNEADDEGHVAEGVYRLYVGSSHCEHLLRQTPVGDVWGIGKRSAERLAAKGIYAAAQLAAAVRNDAEAIRKLLSIAGQRTAYELCGISCVETDEPDIRRSVVASRSFGGKLSEKEELLQAIAVNIENGARRLRAAKLAALSIEIRIRTSPFSADGRHYENAACLNLPEATADARELLKLARAGLDRIFKPGLKYAKSGIMLYNLQTPSKKQLSLWDVRPTAADKNKELMAAVDRVNQKFGADTLRPATLAAGARMPQVTMRREMLSPAWTTDWAALPKVKCG